MKDSPHHERGEEVTDAILITAAIFVAALSMIGAAATDNPVNAAIWGCVTGWLVKIAVDEITNAGQK